MELTNSKRSSRRSIAPLKNSSFNVSPSDTNSVCTIAVAVAVAVAIVIVIVIVILCRLTEHVEILTKNTFQFVQLLTKFICFLLSIFILSTQTLYSILNY